MSPGGPQETRRRSPGDPKRHPEAPKGTQGNPAGCQEPRRVFEVKCGKTIEFYNKTGESDHFRVDGSDLTLTKSAAGRQKWAGVEEARVRERKH